MDLPSRIQSAIENFAKIPGVRNKTAMRQILQMCNWDKRDLMEFGRSIVELGELKKCEQCGFYSEENICSIC